MFWTLARRPAIGQSLRRRKTRLRPSHLSSLHHRSPGHCLYPKRSSNVVCEPIEATNKPPTHLSSDKLASNQLISSPTVPVLEPPRHDSIPNPNPNPDPSVVKLPQYLKDVYWWAYVHPNAIKVFEREWLVNLILWGNFTKLRDIALREIGPVIQGNVLQIACVYGDFTQQIVKRLDSNAHLSVVDVAPVQIENLRMKLRNLCVGKSVSLHLQDASDLQFPDGHFDNVVVFFLLHEMPETVRAGTISHALRVLKKGRSIVFVDYHRPKRRNPFYYIMYPVLRILEPFALDLWEKDIEEYFPENMNLTVRKELFFGDLYQKVVVTK